MALDLPQQVEEHVQDGAVVGGLPGEKLVDGDRDDVLGREVEGVGPVVESDGRGVVDAADVVPADPRGRIRKGVGTAAALALAEGDRGRVVGVGPAADGDLAGAGRAPEPAVAGVVEDAVGGVRVGVDAVVVVEGVAEVGPAVGERRGAVRGIGVSCHVRRLLPAVVSGVPPSGARPNPVWPALRRRPAERTRA